MTASLWFSVVNLSLKHPLQILTEISARILARFWPARLPRSRRDLSEISNSRWPLTRRDSRQDLKILSRFSLRSQNLGGQKLAKNLVEILAEILARSQNLGGQKLTEILAKISKSLRPETR